MDDIFERTPSGGQPPLNEGQTADAPMDSTRTLPPVETAAPSRRRRSGHSYENHDAAPLVHTLQTSINRPKARLLDEAPTPADTQRTPIGSQLPKGEDGAATLPRFQISYQPPVPGSVPSQGVPRPAALNRQENASSKEGSSGQQDASRQEGAARQDHRRPVYTAGQGEVRRPVQAEGYTPVRPRGVNRAEQVTLPPRRAADADKRPLVPVLDDGEEYEEERSGKGLVAVIIVLLLIAALVLGFLLIPDDMEGPLGEAKRAVMGLLGKDEPTALPAATDDTIVPGEIGELALPDAADPASPETSIEPDTPVNPAIPETSYDPAELPGPADADEPTPALVITPDEDGQEAANPGDAAMPETTEEGILPADLPPEEEQESPLPTEELTVPDAADPVEPTEPEAAAVTPRTVPTETPAPVTTPTPTIPVTPTPTLAVTPTPTVLITPTPTPEITPTPTPSPTLTPEPEPTPSPTPAPTPTPQLVAAAVKEANPSLISTQKIYKGNRKVDSYERQKPLNMPAGDDYLTRQLGVTTFRSNAFRMNGAVGTVAPPTSMKLEWSVEAGSMEIRSGMRYGFGVYSQPVIVKWVQEVRQAMELGEGYNDKVALKEVILAGEDGKVYFLDLADGQPTRDALDMGFAMRATVSVHPLNYPLVVFGQFSNKLPNSKLTKSIGLYYYSLMDGKQLRLIDGLDGDIDRQYYNVGAFDTSALIDRNTNTLIAIGTNGLLYTETLDMSFATNDGGVFDFKGVTEQAVLMSHTKNQKESYAAVESSLAAYGPYAFYADMDGILRCVDTTTMTTVWAVDTGDAVRAAVALDLDEETHTLWLYTANTITNRSGAKDKDVTIRRFNAMTGEEDWALPVSSARKSSMKDVYGKEVAPGAVASPVIGQHGLSDLVYFTLSGVSAAGSEALTGKDAAQPSMLIAISKADGEVVWTLPMDAYSYSSPVAVYAEDGRGWVIQCCSNGTIYLTDGLTGQVVSTLQVPGTIEGSPAVYGDTMVFGTTGKDESYIHAVKLQ